MSIETGRRTLNDQVAEEIRALLGRKRMSQAELARRLDVSGAWISYRLAGKQPIDLNDLDAIADVLGVQPGDLLAHRPDASGASSRAAIEAFGRLSPGGEAFGRLDPSAEAFGTSRRRPQEPTAGFAPETHHPVASRAPIRPPGRSDASTRPPTMSRAGRRPQLFPCNPSG